MARIRSLKPEFFSSRSLRKVSPIVRLTFAGLWCEADDNGVGIADAPTLKGHLWPGDREITEDVVEEHLQALADTGHITLYEVDGERYYAVRSWEKHQPPSSRRGEGKYPKPNNGTPWSPPPRGILHDESCSERDSASRVVLVQGSGVRGQVSRSSSSSELQAAPQPVDDDNAPAVTPELVDACKVLAQREAGRYADIVNLDAWTTARARNLAASHAGRHPPGLTAEQLLDVIAPRPRGNLDDVLTRVAAQYGLDWETVRASG